MVDAGDQSRCVPSATRRPGLFRETDWILEGAIQLDMIRRGSCQTAGSKTTAVGTCVSTPLRLPGMLFQPNCELAPTGTLTKRNGVLNGKAACKNDG